MISAGIGRTLVAAAAVGSSLLLTACIADSGQPVSGSSPRESALSKPVEKPLDKFAGLPPKAAYVAAASAAEAMAKAGMAEKNQTPPRKPVIEPESAWASKPGAAPEVMLRYPSSELVIRRERSGWKNSAKAMRDEVVRVDVALPEMIDTFAGMPALGFEEGMVAGDPNGEGAWFKADSTTLMWSDGTYRYVLMSGDQSIEEIQASANELFGF